MQQSNQLIHQNKHIVKSYDKDLNSIAGTIDHIVDLLDISITLVENSIINPSADLIEKIKINDYKINNLDHLNERKVTTMLALRQPMAVDLRYIITALKTSSNLEKIGDKCKSIIKNIVNIPSKIDKDTAKLLLKMLNIAKEMIKDSVLAFNKQDLDLANQVLKKDDEIDLIYKNLFSINQNSNFSAEEVKNIINILFIAKNCERLADYAVNIAEMVNYVISGEIVEN